METQNLKWTFEREAAGRCRPLLTWCSVFQCYPEKRSCSHNSRHLPVIPLVFYWLSNILIKALHVKPWPFTKARTLPRKSRQRNPWLMSVSLHWTSTGSVFKAETGCCVSCFPEPRAALSTELMNNQGIECTHEQWWMRVCNLSKPVSLLPSDSWSFLFTKMKLSLQAFI